MYEDMVSFIHAITELVVDISLFRIYPFLPLKSLMNTFWEKLQS